MHSLLKMKCIELILPKRSDNTWLQGSRSGSCNMSYRKHLFASDKRRVLCAASDYRKLHLLPIIWFICCIFYPISISYLQCRKTLRHVVAKFPAQKIIIYHTTYQTYSFSVLSWYVFSFALPRCGTGYVGLAWLATWHPAAPCPAATCPR